MEEHIYVSDMIKRLNALHEVEGDKLADFMMSRSQPMSEATAIGPDTLVCDDGALSVLSLINSLLGLDSHGRGKIAGRIDTVTRKCVGFQRANYPEEEDGA